ncbi:hypothetical protein [Bradyrhizobium sp.]|uniref:hypothetical protein n=1 Tax=Bradyrhizobium sp. TaxID=376 RepID=UPI0026342000|nr:hypothetical protein [Bradyrhizobium sp.]
MRAVFVSCLLAALATSALAEPADTKSTASAFTYSASGTCLASPQGFNARLEPVYTGVAWTMTFASNGSVDDHGAASEVGQFVDTASFGVGPRMHAPAAHAYNSTFSASVSESQDNGAMFRAGAASGTFTAGPTAGKSFGISSFELKRLARRDGADVYGGASPIVQTFSLGDGTKFERVCVLTVTVFPAR